MGKRTERSGTPRSGTPFAFFCMDAGRGTRPFQGRSVENGISLLRPTIPSVRCPFNGNSRLKTGGLLFIMAKLQI